MKLSTVSKHKSNVIYGLYSKSFILVLSLLVVAFSTSTVVFAESDNDNFNCDGPSDRAHSFCAHKLRSQLQKKGLPMPDFEFLTPGNKCHIIPKKTQDPDGIFSDCLEIKLKDIENKEDDKENREECKDEKDKVNEAKEAMDSACTEANITCPDFGKNTKSDESFDESEVFQCEEAMKTYALGSAGVTDRGELKNLDTEAFSQCAARASAGFDDLKESYKEIKKEVNEKEQALADVLEDIQNQDNSVREAQNNYQKQLEVLGKKTRDLANNKALNDEALRNKTMKRKLEFIAKTAEEEDKLLQMNVAYEAKKKDLRREKRAQVRACWNKAEKNVRDRRARKIACLQGQKRSCDKAVSISGHFKNRIKKAPGLWGRFQFELNYFYRGCISSGANKTIIDDLKDEKGQLDKELTAQRIIVQRRIARIDDQNIVQDRLEALERTGSNTGYASQIEAIQLGYKNSQRDRQTALQAIQTKKLSLNRKLDILNGLRSTKRNNKIPFIHGYDKEDELMMGAQSQLDILIDELDLAESRYKIAKKYGKGVSTDKKNLYEAISKYGHYKTRHDEFLEGEFKGKCSGGDDDDSPAKASK